MGGRTEKESPKVKVSSINTGRICSGVGGGLARPRTCTGLKAKVVGSGWKHTPLHVRAWTRCYLACYRLAYVLGVDNRPTAKREHGKSTRISDHSLSQRRPITAPPSTAVTSRSWTSRHGDATSSVAVRNVRCRILVKGVNGPWPHVAKKIRKICLRNG